MAGKPKSRMQKTVYIALGSLCFVLGAIGIVLPLLPTTPFWLLTAYFYLKGSRRLYDRVMRLPVFGNHIRYFQQYKAIPLRGKITSVVVLWVMVLISSYIVKNIWLVILLLLIAIGVTIHILSYKTLRKEDIEREKENRDSE